MACQSCALCVLHACLQVTLRGSGKLEDGTVFDEWPLGEELVYVTDEGVWHLYDITVADTFLYHGCRRLT